MDGRYELQVKLEVSSKIFEINEMGIQSYIKWIETNLPENCTVGYDPKLFSITEIETYIKRFENHQIKLKSSSKILNLGLPDEFIEHGDQEQQKILNGLDANGIEKSIKEKLKLI